MFALLLTSILTLAFNIQPVKATGIIYIRADGRIDPPTANITSADNVTYTFTDNNNDYVEVQRDNITVDGEGFNLLGTGIGGRGISLEGRSNVTVKNIRVRKFSDGIYLYGSSNCTIFGNNITANINAGIYLENSSNNTIFGNNITANMNDGIEIYYSSNYNSVYRNNITHNSRFGISVSASSNYNSIYENDITNNKDGIESYSYSNNNSVFRNNIIANNVSGVYFSHSINNRFYHNNFINNAQPVSITLSDVNFWDNSYPSGGNYWSDHAGVDLFSGSYQNETGNDGIGDSPYAIDENNQDNYPLIDPWVPPDIAVMNVTPSKTVVGQGFPLCINVTVTNQGNKIEGFNVTSRANATVIQTENVMLMSENSTTIALTWNTTGVPYGNYTISAYASLVLGEIDMVDNSYTDGKVVVTIQGDINGDGTVNILDAIRLAGAFGAEPGDQNWNPNADINGDGRVNILDAIILAGHFGETV